MAVFWGKGVGKREKHKSSKAWRRVVGCDRGSEGELVRWESFKQPLLRLGLPDSKHDAQLKVNFSSSTNIGLV